MNKILIIAAHPDDDVLGCGGYMSSLSKDSIIKVIFLAEGSSCRFSKEEISSKVVKNAIKLRNECAIKSLEILNIKNFCFYNLPCGRLDQVPIIDINKIIENEIREFKPDIVFTHSNKDANNDHLIVHKATIIATRPGSDSSVSKLYAYEVLSSTEWKFTDSFKPNFFHEITELDLKIKWKALEVYKSEMRPYPFPRSFEAIKSLAQFRGIQCSKHYAESFELIREISSSS